MRRGTPVFQRFHGLTSASYIQKLKEEFDANEETKRRSVPIIYTNPVDRGVTIVTLVGHFCVHRELFGEHVVGAPAESPGQVITG